MFHTFILNLIVSVTFLFLIINSPTAESNLIKVYAQQQQQQQQQNQESPNSSIVLTAKMIDNQYRWIDADTNAINPTLNMTAGIDNEITVKSLEGDYAEHELVIEGVSSNAAASGNDDDKDNDKGGGKELVKSDEIKDGSSATVNFDSADIQEDDDNSNYQSFEYYCEYHPDTMRGKIQIK
jgi:plastocyanin